MVRIYEKHKAVPPMALCCFVEDKIIICANGGNYCRRLRLYQSIISETVKGIIRYTANQIQLLVFTARITM